MLYNLERPTTLDEVAGQEVVVAKIRNQAKQNNFFQFHIMSGQWGSGKTSVARILSLMVNCEHLTDDGNPCMECPSCKQILSGEAVDIMEIDGASNNGVDKVRELIESTQFSPISLRCKVYIIDEVHMLTEAAFNALLKTLEEPPAHCIFILCTTELKKIPHTIRSRAAKYDFKKIEPAVMQVRLRKVSEKHGASITDDALKLLSKLSLGSMRDAYCILEQCISASKSIDDKLVKELFGIEDSEVIYALLTSLAKKDSADIIQRVNQLYSAGKDMISVIDDMLDMLTDAVVYHSTKNKSCLQNTQSYIDNIVSLCDITSIERLFLFSNELYDLRNALRNDNSKTTTLVRLLRISGNMVASYDELVTRIVELESQIKTISLSISSVSCSPERSYTYSNEVITEPIVISEESPMTLQEKDVKLPSGFAPSIMNPFDEGGEGDELITASNPSSSDVETLKEELSVKSSDTEILNDTDNKRDSDTNVPDEIDFLSDFFDVFPMSYEIHEPKKHVAAAAGASDDTVLDSVKGTIVEDVLDNAVDENIFTVPHSFDNKGEETGEPSSATNYKNIPDTSLNEDISKSSYSPSEEAEEEYSELIAACPDTVLSAIDGCTRRIQNGNIIFSTRFQPHYEILKTFLTHVGATHVLVEKVV